MADNTTDAYSALVRSESSVSPTPPPAHPSAEDRQILAVTEQLFPGPIDVRQEIDPEIPGHHYLVLEVVASGDFDDIMARDRQWHRMVAEEVTKSANVYTLSIDIRE